MVVKFFRPRNGAKSNGINLRNKLRNNNSNKARIPVGQLVGSKTYTNSVDVRDDDDDDEEEVQGDDNASALELALHHSETDIAKAAAAPTTEAATTLTDSKAKFRLLRPSIMTKRKGNNPTSIVAPKTEALNVRSSVDEKRQDTTTIDEVSKVPENDAKSLSTLETKMMEQHSVAGSINNYRVVSSPLEITVTPEMLTGLMNKRYAQSVKAASANKNNSKLDGSNNKNNGSMKVKGYIRVVRKASGVKIVSGSPKIVKSYRLGTITTAKSAVVPDYTTLTFTSPEPIGLKSTGSIKIRLPPPIVTTTGAKGSNGNKPIFNILTFEVGVLTPEGIFPLGNATYQPFSKHGEQLQQQKVVLKIDPIRKGSMFQRRKVVSIGASSEGSTLVKDADFRLQRKSTISMVLDIKEISEKDYFTSIQKQKLEKSDKKSPINKAKTEVDGQPASTDRNAKIENDIVTSDAITSNDVIKGTNEFTDDDIAKYLANPLSCCSGSYEETTLNDTLFTETVVKDVPITDSTNLPAQITSIENDNESDAGVVDIALKEQAAESSNEIDDPGCCFFFFCCAGSSNEIDSENNKNDGDEPSQDVSRQKAVPATGSMIYDAAVQDQYVENVAGSTEEIEKYDATHFVYEENADDILRDPSDVHDTHLDASIVGSRNCCMTCFGDEDVEKLRYPPRLASVDQPSDKPREVSNTEVTKVSSEEAGAGGSRELVQQQSIVTNSPEVEGNDVKEQNIQIGADNRRARLDAVLDTMSSSYTDGNDADGDVDDDDDDEASVYAVSFEDDFDDNVGCFYWMGAASSDGQETLNSLSVMSSVSLNDDSLAGMEVNANQDKIPISKSEDLTAALPMSDVRNKIHHSISIS